MIRRRPRQVQDCTPPDSRELWLRFIGPLRKRECPATVPGAAYVTYSYRSPIARTTGSMYVR